jgi:N-acetylglucosamine-6-sulfatase
MPVRGLLAALLAALCLACALPVGAAQAAPARPNIVLVLTDDLSWNLVRHMPHVRSMQRRGVTFSRYLVTNSLCCPSRASILTGQYPHNTGVLSNEPPTGGFEAFQALGDESHTFATALQGVGYRTAMMGKYLNGYQPRVAPGATTGYVPPGWTEWDVAGNGYPELGYTLNVNGSVVRYGKRPEDYLTDVLAARGTTFIDRSVAAGDPFLLELATFSPHKPYAPAPRDVHTFGRLRAPRDASFNTPNADPPGWLARRGPLSGRQLAGIDADYRNRVRAVQSVDQLLGSVEATLRTHGIARKTYVVFTSDNGYHMGEHRLTPGKQTVFDTDIRVPLIVTGPRVPAGRTVSRLAANIDLRSTFGALAGAPLLRSQVDGASLINLLRGRRVGAWRQGVLIEHQGAEQAAGDPDAQSREAGLPGTYHAVRTARSVYAEYESGEREYYDLGSDPLEMTNTYARLAPARRARLHRLLVALEACRGTGSCLKASRTP